MKLASRLNKLQISIYSELAALKEEIKHTGKTLIDLSIGSPDLSPPREVQELISEQALDDRVYDYTLTRGTAEFREACANWYKQRFNVDLDPETEVLPVMGSQDGLAHIFWAFIDKGDAALIPDPGYPIYTDGLALVEGEKIPLPLLSTNDFLPDFSQLSPQQAQKAKLMILNYPNNPTTATAGPEFFDQVVEFASKYKIIVCHDAAYTELAYAGTKPVSFLQAEGAKEVGVEFHSLSKSFNLAGLRLGFVVGNARVIKALETIKTNIDYGSFRPFLKAGTMALSSCQKTIETNQQTYKRRSEIWFKGCEEAGWDITRPRATMFVWAPVPTKQDSLSFVMDLARKSGVLLVPGVAFGEHGEGYVRIGLVQKEALLKEAVNRIKTFLLNED
ncbi:MAG: aminotransferase class I/II-fold pyridoxal phosphate-dependent enzyme [Peptococcaceae bacterium]|nr:aminotransferase class I/II-fold pyridoxal phosphate-dependent enzyme [Peptococcaceae bacterium]